MDWQSLYLQDAAGHGSGGAEGKPRLIPIPQPASDRKYVCPTCGIAFPTHYALGGHAKSHSDRDVSRFFGEKILQGGRYSAAHAFGSSMAQQYQRQGGAVVVPGAAIGVGLGGIWNIPPPLPEARDSMRHPCSRCSLVFSTGQALGGHMRMHLQAEKERMEAVAAVAEASAVAAARPTVPRLDIDLNKPPME